MTLLQVAQRPAHRPTRPGPSWQIPHGAIFSMHHRAATPGAPPLQVSTAFSPGVLHIFSMQLHVIIVYLHHATVSNKQAADARDLYASQVPGGDQQVCCPPNDKSSAVLMHAEPSGRVDDLVVTILLPLQPRRSSLHVITRRVTAVLSTAR